MKSSIWTLAIYSSLQGQHTSNQPTVITRNGCTGSEVSLTRTRGNEATAREPFGGTLAQFLRYAKLLLFHC